MKNFITSLIPKFSYCSSSSINWFFVLLRKLFKNLGSSFTLRTTVGQYCGKNISVVWIGRVGTGAGGGGGDEAPERGGGTGDLRSVTGGGWFWNLANRLLASLSSSSNLLRRFRSSLYL